jgi:transcriptional regulator with XRE-family HTH domain
VSSFAQRLRALREKRNWRQKDVAEKLGITESAYGYYEQGRREPSNESLQQLAQIFNVTVDYLLTGRTGSDKETSQDPIPPEEREFLEWVKNNLEGTFFYDFSRAPEEQKRDMMKSLRIIWELEKHRKPGQKQGE